MTSQVANEEADAEPIGADFDHHDPTFGRCAYEVLDRSRATQSVSRSEKYGGFWVITSYEDVSAAAHAPEVFSNRVGPVFPPLPGSDTESMIPIALDPPEHAPYRRILGPAFGPAEISKRAGVIRDVTNYLIDQFIEDGSVDFSHQLGVPLTAIVTLRMLGLDATQWPRYAEVSHLGWKHGWIPNLPPEQRDPLLAKLGEGYAWILGTISDRINEVRENPVGDTLIDHLVQAEIGGRPLPHNQVMYIVHNVYEAGLDTTAAAVASMTLRLGEDPQLRARLVQEPEKIPAFVEEALRIQSPVITLARLVSRDCTFAGHEMKKDDAVLLSWAAANRDPAQFPNPTTFDADRNANRHIAFGLGPHRCLGSHIARLELRIVLEELLRRIPEFTVDREHVVLNADCGTAFGYYNVPATFVQAPKCSTATEADVLNGAW
jgi:cytochrome P450